MIISLLADNALFVVVVVVLLLYYELECSSSRIFNLFQCCFLYFLSLVCSFICIGSSFLIYFRCFCWIQYSFINNYVSIFFFLIFLYMCVCVCCFFVSFFFFFLLCDPSSIYCFHLISFQYI